MDITNDLHYASNLTFNNERYPFMTTPNQTSQNHQSFQFGTWNQLTQHSDLNVPGKFFLHRHLGLTSCEISVNCLKAGLAAPFTHKHKLNEEIYLVVSGTGDMWVDGEMIALREGSVIRIDPDGERAIRAGNEDLIYICIQAPSKGLKQKTEEDGVVINPAFQW